MADDIIFARSSGIGIAPRRHSGAATEFLIENSSVPETAIFSALSQEQRNEIENIMKTESSVIGLLTAQLIKSRRRLTAAKHSDDFLDEHERTLIAEQQILMGELSAATMRLKSRICALVSPVHGRNSSGSHD